MASTHLYLLNGLTGASWSTAGVKAQNLWVWHSGAWHSVIKQWVWDSGTWRLCFDTTPGPLATITVTPANPTVAEGTVQTFTANGFDADGRSVTISPTWSITTITDSIDSSGNFTAGSSTDSGTVTATVGSISGSTGYTVP